MELIWGFLELVPVNPLLSYVATCVIIGVSLGTCQSMFTELSLFSQLPLFFCCMQIGG